MKYCAKCGNANADEALFCAGCGTPLEQAPVAPQQAAQPAPAPVQAAAPSPAQPAYGAQPSAYAVPSYSGPDIQTKNSTTVWLVLNIVSTLLCCPGALFSIIGLIFGILGSGSFNKGDYADMAKKSKISMILFIVSVVLGLLGWILGVVLYFVLKNNSGY